MNVLHIARRFYPGVGGVETYIKDICEELTGLDINCRVLTLNYDILDKNKKYKDYENLGGIEIFRIPGFGSYKKPVPLKIPLDVFKWADVIHIHDVRFLFESACFLKMFFKYAIIFSTHGFILHTGDLAQIKYFMIPLYYKPMFRIFADRISCVSIQDYNYFRNKGLKQSILMENGLNLKDFLNIDKKIMPGKLLYFGRLDKNKGLDLLFNALAKVKFKNWSLDIIGAGTEDLVCKLKNMASALNIAGQISWHGFVDRKELLKKLEEASLCFFPSIYEGFGYTLVEAMASGNICIANNIEAFRNITGSSNAAYLVDFTDFEASANLIDSLLSGKPGLLETVGRKAGDHAKRFSWPGKIPEIVKLYRNISH